jgi:hypothetical protein
LCSCLGADGLREFIFRNKEDSEDSDDDLDKLKEKFEKYKKDAGHMICNKSVKMFICKGAIIQKMQKKHNETLNTVMKVKKLLSTIAGRDASLRNYLIDYDVRC